MDTEAPSPLPEWVNLMLASALVAFLLHLFFASRCADPAANEMLGGTVGRLAADNSVAVDRSQPANDSENVNAKGEKDASQVLGVSASPVDEDRESFKKKRAERNDMVRPKEEPFEHAVTKSVGRKLGSEKRPSRGMEGKVESAQSNVDGDHHAATKQQQQTPASQPPIELKSQAKHPGLHHYYKWHATSTSLYRVYAIPFYENEAGNGKKYHPAILPMHPSSERGNVSVYIEVTNRTSHNVDVYWLDYKGREVYKGSMSSHGGTWTQTTYIGHPWTFRKGEGEENVLLRYTPFRIVPSIAGAETAKRGGGTVEGTQKFIVRDVLKGHAMRWNWRCVPVCWVEDDILPEPPLVPVDNRQSIADNVSSFSNSELNDAIQWSCQQIQREDAIYHGKGVTSAKRLLQYLKNICLQPTDPKYRRLRLGNRIFREVIYNTGARGVLLALGFEEIRGHMECGPGGGRTLGMERIQQISDAMLMVHETLKVMEGCTRSDGSDAVLAQPLGSDGFGRAGFGYAGEMNI